MKHKLLAVAGVVTAMGIGGVALLPQWAFNNDAAQIVALRVAELARQNGGKLPEASTIDREIASLIEASVIHGSVAHGVPANVWGNSFAVELSKDRELRCRSPGLFGVLGSSEHAADIR